MRCPATSRDYPLGCDGKINSEAGAVPEIPLLLFSGRLIERKGVNYLLSAAVDFEGAPGAPGNYW